MTTPVIIDIAAAAVLLGFAVFGAKRGLFRAIAGLLIAVLALLGARAAAQALAPPAARMMKPVIERRIEQKLDEALSAAPDLLPGLSGDIPDPAEELLGLLGVEGSALDMLAEQAREIVRDTGASVLSAVAQSAAESFFYGLIYILTFLILTILLNLAAGVMDLALKLPVLHGANALGGAAVGLVEGILVLFLLALAAKKLGVPLDGSLISRIFMARAA